MYPPSNRFGYVTLAAVALAAVLPGCPFGPCPSCRAAAPAGEAPKFDHFVPADKKLPATWVKGLFEKGQTPVYRGKALETIGMPIGGIAAGQLYLLGDGRLGLWQIFNKHINTGYGSVSYKRRVPDSPVEQGFAVTVETGGQRQTRTLDRQGFAGVDFVGQYPIGLVRYREKGFPVTVQMEAFSPFVPLNAKDSALPATVFHLTLENVSSQEVQASIDAWLENAVCFHSCKIIAGLRQSRVVVEKGRTLIVHTAQKSPEAAKAAPPRPAIVLADFEGPDYAGWTATGEAFGKAPAKGALPNQQKVTGFVGKGLVNTFLGGDVPHGKLTSPPIKVTRKYLNFLIGGGKHPGKTCINLLVDGKLARTATGKSAEALVWRAWNVGVFEGKEARIEIVDRDSGAWGHINIDQIELSDKRREGPTGPVDKMADYGSMVLASAEPMADPSQDRCVLVSKTGKGIQVRAEKTDPYPLSQKRTTVTRTRPAKLAPGAKRSWTFVLAWHFPNHQHGREYAVRFPHAQAVAHYVLDHHERLTTDTRTWRDTYYDSTLPVWLLDRLHSTVSYLATNTCEWWKNGRFWAYEGVGCCQGTCTHVWNYEHAGARLFPELERSIREMQDFGEGFDARTGLVGFRSNRAYAADGQCGTVLKAYREHLMSPDDAFLKRNWPRIRKALLYSISHDKNDDGLIEDLQHNTYDINYYGPNTFVGSLYLAALRAAEEMAMTVGDLEFAKRARRIYQSGRRLSVERLWNGEYFIQIVDLKKHPKHQYAEGCLADQLFGQGWAHQLSLGYIYPQEHVLATLRSIWRYNWAPDVGPQNKAHKPRRVFADPGEPGLFTCTWPKSKHLDPHGMFYRNEIWTGIEYQVAGNMVWDGMLTEALAIVRGIHDRYAPLKRNPYNEVECGDHYARAMASWGVFTALAGYEYHGPRGHLGFAPRITPEDFRSAFTAAEGWGTFTQKREANRQRERIEVRWGKLRLKTLAFQLPNKATSPKGTVVVDGQDVPAKATADDGRLSIQLGKEVTLTPGQSLDVTITWADK